MKEFKMPGKHPGGASGQGWDDTAADRPMFANDPAGHDPVEQHPDLSPKPAATMTADEQALLAEIEALRAELAEAETRATNNYEQFVRASAELENVRRRATEDMAKAKKFAIEGFAESLLPVCDSLEMALKVETPTIDSIRQGADTTLRQLQHALERNKVVVVDPVGERFDPNTQQAISMQPSADVPANHVVAVLQKGYLINDRVLRPAMVVVSQGG